MSWISGNLNELEDPIAKVNSWYVSVWMPYQTAGKQSLYGLCMIVQVAGNVIIHPKPSKAPFSCDVAENSIQLKC